MPYTKKSGGTKEFHYSKEDTRRIESEDTESTREFKKALHEWKNKKKFFKKMKGMPPVYHHTKEEKFNIVDKPKGKHYSPKDNFDMKKYGLSIPLKLKKVWRKTKYKAGKFYRRLKPHSHYNSKPLIKNLLILFVIGILMSIVYSNLDKLNSIELIILKLGSCLLLVGLFFFIKYLWRFYKNIKYLIRIQRKWVKRGLIFLLLVLLILAYQHREGILDPAIEKYEEADFGMLYPFTFSLDDIKENLPETSSTDNKVDSSDDETEKGFFEEIFEPEPMNIDLIEAEVLKLVNEERSKYKARSLTSKSDLHSFARSWSEKMINENFFEHSNMGFSFNSYAGENIMETPIHSSVIGCGSTYDEKNMAICIVDGWIGSPGHHENMINPQFSMTGVGVACDGSECKSTQVFMG